MAAERESMAYRTSSKQSRLNPRTLQRLVVGLILLGLMVLAGFLAVGFVRMAWQEHQINKAMVQQRAENDQQRAHNLKLKGQAEFAESDVAAEQVARERLGMARDGETILLPTIVLPPAPTAVPASNEPGAAPRVANAVPEQASNMARWMQAFFPGPDATP